MRMRVVCGRKRLGVGIKAQTAFSAWEKVSTRLGVHVRLLRLVVGGGVGYHLRHTMRSVDADAKIAPARTLQEAVPCLLSLPLRNDPVLARIVLNVEKHLLVLLTLILFGKLPAATDLVGGDVAVHHLPLIACSVVKIG